MFATTVKSPVVPDPSYIPRAPVGPFTAFVIRPSASTVTVAFEYVPGATAVDASSVAPTAPASIFQIDPFPDTVISPLSPSAIVPLTCLQRPAL